MSTSELENLDKPGFNATTHISEPVAAVAEPVVSEAVVDASQAAAVESIAEEVTATAKKIIASASEKQAHAASDQTKENIAASFPHAFDPSMIAFMNSMVRESVAAAMSAVIPTLEKLNAPSPKAKLEAETIEKALDRERREREQSRLQDADARANLLAKQRGCSHRDGNEKSSISLVHNFPDRQPRGICVQCQKWIHPRRYEVAPPSVALGTLENAKEFAALLERENGYARDSIEIYTDPRTKRFTHLLLPADADYVSRVIEQEKRQTMAIA